MRRLLTAIAAAAVAVALLSAPAGAVQGGTPDTGNKYSNVGLSVFLYKGTPLWRCSGTMVAAKVYVTAGHCTGIDPDLGVAPDEALIWFSPGPISRGTYAFDGNPC